MPDAVDLTSARHELGLTSHALWLAYVSLGGALLPPTFAELLDGTRTPGRRDHDLVAHALNEAFVDRGDNHPVPYYADLHPER